MAPQSPLALHFATLKEFYIGKVTLGEGGEIGCCAFLMELFTLKFRLTPLIRFKSNLFACIG